MDDGLIDDGWLLDAKWMMHSFPEKKGDVMVDKKFVIYDGRCARWMMGEDAWWMMQWRNMEDGYGMDDGMMDDGSCIPLSLWERVGLPTGPPTPLWLPDHSESRRPGTYYTYMYIFTYIIYLYYIMCTNPMAQGLWRIVFPCILGKPHSYFTNPMFQAFFWRWFSLN